MLAAVVRVALDFAGPLFGLAIVDLIHILFLIAGKSFSQHFRLVKNLIYMLFFISGKSRGT